MARFTSTQQQSDLHQHSISISKVHLPFSNQPSHILPQPAFTMSSLTLISSFALPPQNLMPFSKHDHPLPTTHDHDMTIPTNTASHSQLIHVSFKPNRNIKYVDLFLPLSCTPHIALTMDLSVLNKIPISLSFRQHASLSQYYWPFITLINNPFLI